ncbi:hypothetical protein [Hydrogenobaculum acidophilum]
METDKDLTLKCECINEDLIRLVFKEKGIHIEISEKIYKSELSFQEVIEIFQAFSIYNRISNKNKQSKYENENSNSKYSDYKDFNNKNHIYSYNVIESIKRLYDKYKEGVFSNFVYRNFYSDVVDDFDLDSLFDDPIYLPNHTIIPYHTKTKMLTKTTFNSFIELYSFVMNSILSLFNIKDENIANMSLSYSYQRSLPYNMFSKDFDEYHLYDLIEHLRELDKQNPLRDKEYIETYEDLEQFLEGCYFLKKSDKNNQEGYILGLIELYDFWEFINIVDIVESKYIIKALDLFGTFYFDNEYDFIVYGLHLKPDLVYIDGNNVIVCDFKFKSTEDILSNEGDVEKQYTYFKHLDTKDIKDIKIEFIIPENAQHEQSEFENKKEYDKFAYINIDIKAKNFYNLVKNVVIKNIDEIDKKIDELKDKLKKDKLPSIENNELKPEELYKLIAKFIEKNHIQDHIEVKIKKDFHDIIEKTMKLPHLTDTDSKEDECKYVYNKICNTIIEYLSNNKINKDEAYTLSKLLYTSIAQCIHPSKQSIVN